MLSEVFHIIILVLVLKIKFKGNSKFIILQKFTFDKRHY